MTPGPPPSTRRRRRNAPAGGEWVDLPPVVDNPTLPPLPRLNRGKWSARTRAAWEAWRKDPATAKYTPADIAYAIDTAHVAELAYEDPTAALLGELRLRMDGLGLTAKGKRNLRWRIKDPGEAGEQDEVARDRAERLSGRRVRLVAVDPDEGA